MKQAISNKRLRGLRKLMVEGVLTGYEVNQIILNEHQKALRRQESARKHARKPEVKARQKAHRQKPEVKAEIIKYQRDYIKRPEVKAKRKAYMRDYMRKRRKGHLSDPKSL